MSKCIEWEGARDKAGYGVTTRHNSYQLAHRVAYADYHGYPIVDLKGWVVMHTCDNPPCINPEHLVLGTQAENLDDAYRKGRKPPTKGSKHGCSKLTEEQVLEIRATEGTLKHIARMYNVSVPTISMIKTRRIWRHV